MDLLTDITLESKPASVAIRWTAALIDYAIVSIIYFVLLMVFGETVTTDDGTLERKVTGWSALFVTFLPWFFLLPFLEGWNGGQTIGKSILRIKVIKNDNSSVGFGLAFVRHLFDIVDYAPFFGIVGVIVASNSKKFKRVGDMVANTMVVKA